MTAQKTITIEGLSVRRLETKESAGTGERKPGSIATGDGNDVYLVSVRKR